MPTPARRSPIRTSSRVTRWIPTPFIEVTMDEPENVALESTKTIEMAQPSGDVEEAGDE